MVGIDVGIDTDFDAAGGGCFEGWDEEEGAEEEGAAGGAGGEECTDGVGSDEIGF